MKFYLKFFVIILSFNLFFPLAAEKVPISGQNSLFRFKLELNDILSVDKYQDILINDGLSQVTKEEKNRIVLKVIQKEADYVLLEGNFTTYSRSPRRTGEFKLESNFFSRFKIYNNGRYEVPEEYIMPNLRDLPTFPNFPLDTKGRWVSPAMENLNLDRVNVKIPVNVNYRYTGITPLVEAAYSFNSHAGYRNREFDRFEYNYTISHMVKERRSPVRQVGGFSSDVFWFDRDNGIPIFDSNRIAYTFKLQNGQTVNYNFKILSWYRKTKRLDPAEKERIAAELTKELKPSNELSVRKTDEGIVLSIDAILFQFDSATLTQGAQNGLNQIATILNRYPDREIRISGHTDNSGSDSYNQELSTRRARNVLKYLKRADVDDRRMSYRGYGEKSPVADNSTTEGRARNRRVEVLIVTD